MGTLDPQLYLLPLLIFVIAGLYSSVGHGGASGYLAVLAVTGIPAMVLRPSALVLNLFVSSIAFIGFSSTGHFRWRTFWPFILGSIPFTFIGAGIALDPVIYNRLLSVCLLIAVGRMLGISDQEIRVQKAPPILPAIGIGAVIGLLSGMIGIGGGIILGPILILLRWSTIREAAAVCALFILVNSATGLIAIPNVMEMITVEILAWLSAAIAGGLLGTYLGAKRYSDLRLRQVLGVVLIFAAIKLFMV